MLNKKVKKTLEERSIEAVDVFTKTATELEAINSEIDAEVEAKHQAILKLETECDKLTGRASKNKKIVSKIKAILEE